MKHIVKAIKFGHAGCLRIFGKKYLKYHCWKRNIFPLHVLERYPSYYVHNANPSPFLDKHPVSRLKLYARKLLNIPEVCRAIDDILLIIDSISLSDLNKVGKNIYRIRGKITDVGYAAKASKIISLSPGGLYKKSKSTLLTEEEFGVLARSYRYLSAYMMNLSHCRTPKYEHRLLARSKDAISYANKFRFRWPELESIPIDREHTMRYIEYISRESCQWNEVRDVATNDPRLCVPYLKAMKSGRVQELEERYGKIPGWCYEYARDIIKGRWIEAERIILSNKHLANEYVKNIINKSANVDIWEPME